MSSADGVDVVAPKQLILPTMSGAFTHQAKTTGSIFISGAKIYWYNGSAMELITSA